MELAGARVTVMGLARSGVAACRLLQAAGARVTVADRKESAELTSVLGGIDASRRRDRRGPVRIVARRGGSGGDQPRSALSASPARSGASARREGDQRIGARLAVLPKPTPCNHWYQWQEHDRDPNRQVSRRERQAGVCRRKFGHRLERSGAGRPSRQPGREPSPYDYLVVEVSSFSLKRSIFHPGSPPAQRDVDHQDRMIAG